MDDYPIQGKLRIRAENYERDIAFIRERVGKLSKTELKNMPGYEFLKFWYVDFAATHEQWAALAPELDRRNILVTLYEAPLFFMEALAEEEQTTRQKQSGRLIWLYNGAALAIFAVAATLVVMVNLDWGACLLLAAVALLVALAGQVHATLRARGASERSSNHTVN